MLNINNFCYINNKDLTNECDDPNYIRLYYNKDSQVSKLNTYGPPPSMEPGPLNPNKPMNPGDSYNNKDILNPKGAPISKSKLKTEPKINNLTNNLNYTSNSNISDNSTLSYGHIVHNSKYIKILTEKQ